jgi:nitroreductase
METIDLYDNIFKRKSVRRYEATPLDEDTLTKITRHMATIKPLNDGIKTELRILPGNAVNGIFRIRAPHYLALFSEEKEGHLTNAGFILQQMDLYLSAIGVGSCWLALAKPSKEYLKKLRTEVRHQPRVWKTV